MQYTSQFCQQFLQFEQKEQRVCHDCLQQALALFAVVKDDTLLWYLYHRLLQTPYNVHPLLELDLEMHVAGKRHQEAGEVEGISDSATESSVPDSEGISQAVLLFWSLSSTRLNLT